ncbi:hypothetical protein BDY24DRAFT_378175 [Mrakia frigida]|uniref:uncharacterized protein n=1 Tax=Mrakia frigida TaxID=29902 RepID=UPI003FCBF8D5
MPSNNYRRRSRWTWTSIIRPLVFMDVKVLAHSYLIFPPLLRVQQLQNLQQPPLVLLLRNQKLNPSVAKLLALPDSSNSQLPQKTLPALLLLNLAPLFPALPPSEVQDVIWQGLDELARKRQVNWVILETRHQVLPTVQNSTTRGYLEQPCPPHEGVRDPELVGFDDLEQRRRLLLLLLRRWVVDLGVGFGIQMSKDLQLSTEGLVMSPFEGYVVDGEMERWVGETRAR